MSPNFSNDGDEDTCGCTMGSSCAYHAEQSRRRKAASDAAYRAEGIDPNKQIGPGLAELVLAVECSTAISEDQKRAIRKILFR